MKRFQRGDNTWSILDTLRQSVLSSAAPEGIVCPYCGKACSKTVRQCVESSGTRKQLKAKIREVEKPYRKDEDLSSCSRSSVERSHRPTRALLMLRTARSRRSRPDSLSFVPFTCPSWKPTSR
jgi:hypothetical protein